MSILTDGFSTIINMPQAGITLFEKEVTPPAVDGGGPNDTTTMRNTNWRTKQPKRLKTLSEMKGKVAYDPAFYNTVVANVNVNQALSVRFSDGSRIGFWGWIDKFTPDAIKEGEQPTAEITIQCSNQDNGGFEQPPVYTGP